MYQFDPELRIHRVVAGKLRRYNHLTLWQQLTWPSLVLLNIRDGLLVLVGIIQSIIKLLLWRPDVIFAKGGYVCLPVGIAGYLLRIPLVIHDSDAHPGLTNKVLSRWAKAIATGSPVEYYPYDRKKTHYVGIPINTDFKIVSQKKQLEEKQKWGIGDRPLIVVTGGGLGAQRINMAILEHYSKFKPLGSIILISGAANYDEALEHMPPANQDELQVVPFASDMASLIGAADVVIARAGATTILELAASKKPTILIPNAKLTGGHQLKNAAVYAEKDAVKIVNEETLDPSPKELVAAVKQLLEDKEQASQMAERFHRFSRPDAAEKVAELVVSAARRTV